MFKHLPLVLKNGWRNKRRTLLTIFSIGASLCLLGVLMAIYHAFYFSEPTADSAMRLVTRNKVSLAVPMPEAYEQKIKQIPGVREVMVEDWFGGVYIDEKNFFPRFAIKPGKLFPIHFEYRMPEDQRQAFEHDRTGCVVGRSLANKYHWKVGDRITLKGDIYPGDYPMTIRGIYDSDINDGVLYLSRDYIEQGLPERRRGNAGVFLILADSVADVPRVSEAIDTMFNNAPVQTKTETESAFSISFLAFLGNVKLFLLSVGGAVTFTILLVSGNTVAMSVRERVREVGILKTLGYSRGIILTIILGEAVAMCLLGGVVGLVLAWALTFLVRHGPQIAAQLSTLTLGWSVSAACLALAAFIGLISAFIPAWNASRLSILDALRATD